MAITLSRDAFDLYDAARYLSPDELHRLLGALQALERTQIAERMRSSGDADDELDNAEVLANKNALA